MSIINPMLIVRPVTTQAQAAAPAEGRHYDLRAGQLVNATVAEGGHSEVLLDLNQQRLRAQTRIPLQTGQKLRLQVVKNGPQLQLRVLQNNVLERLSHAIHLLEGKSDLTGALQQLTSSKSSDTPRQKAALNKLLDFLTPLKSATPEALSGKNLQLLARHLGLTLEAELAQSPESVEPANLKSLLLAHCRNNDSRDPDAADPAEQLLQKLELFQLCNLRLARQAAMLLPLPLPFLDNGYLVAERDGSSDEEQRQAKKISLYLSLEGLGELRIDLLQEKEGLFVRFTCDNSDKSSFLAKQEQELRDLLTALPLCGATYGSEQGTLRGDLIRRILQEGDELLDARV